MPKWIALLLVFACTGVVGWRSADRVVDMDGRLQELELRARSDELAKRALEAELSQVTNRLEVVDGELARRELQVARLRELTTRLLETEGTLAEVRGEVLGQAELLAALESERSSFDPRAVEAHFAALDRSMREQWESAFELASSAVLLADESKVRLEQLAADVRRRDDHRRMWRELVGPVVQLAGEESVGSGILLESRAKEDEPRTFVTYLLTAWHVVRDIQGTLANRDMPVPVTIYHEDGSLDFEEASLIDFDAVVDVALLVLDSERRVELGARLAPRSRIEAAEIFAPIYAVGCPLGNAPIPTPGEIAANHHFVDGQTYMMINAPTYVGNSGGGIFDAETHELLGIFSKVYTHGAVRPTIVTHMGLITPLDLVYDWLHQIGYGDLQPAEPDALAAPALDGVETAPATAAARD